MKLALLFRFISSAGDVVFLAVLFSRIIIQKLLNGCQYSLVQNNYIFGVNPDEVGKLKLNVVIDQCK